MSIAFFPGRRHLLRGPVPRVLRHRHLPEVQALGGGGPHQGGHFQPGPVVECREIHPRKLLEKNPNALISI